MDSAQVSIAIVVRGEQPAIVDSEGETPLDDAELSAAARKPAHAAMVTENGRRRP